MKGLLNLAVVIAGVSLLMSIILRFAQIKLLPMAVTANAFLRFTDTALLFAIVFALLQLLKAKKEG